MRPASPALQELELLPSLPKKAWGQLPKTTHPALVSMEENLVRLLGAGLALIAQTPFFLDQTAPRITYAKFTEAAVELEARNRALFLDPTVTEEMTALVRRNMTLISQVSVIGRIGLHLERLDLLVENPVERRWIVSCLGPSADSVFLLGTRIVTLLNEADSLQALPAAEALHWEILMVEGSLQAALEELEQTGVLSRTGRRYTRATLWAFQVARDSLLGICLP